jgi:hypothetical protein
VDMRVVVINVRETAADLHRMADNAPEAVEDALDRGGRWVTLQARDLLRGQIGNSGHLVHYPRSITHEVETSPGIISMIVGPESAKPQGGMGLGVEYGSANTGPKPHLHQAFDDRVDSIVDRAYNNIARWPR